MELLLFAIPILLVGRWSLALSKERNDARYGWGLFVPAIISLAAIYIQGLTAYRDYADRQMWTAASSALAGALFLSAPVLLLSRLAYRWLSRS